PGERRGLRLLGGLAVGGVEHDPERRAHVLRLELEAGEVAVARARGRCCRVGRVFEAHAGCPNGVAWASQSLGPPYKDRGRRRFGRTDDRARDRTDRSGDQPDPTGHTSALVSPPQQAGQSAGTLPPAAATIPPGRPLTADTPSEN